MWSCLLDREAKPTWEFPRLCRGGSKSLTYPAVDTARSIAATRRAAKHTKGIVSMDGLKPDAPHRGAVMQALPPERGSQTRHMMLRHSSVEEGSRGGAARVSRFERLQY